MSIVNRIRNVLTRESRGLTVAQVSDLTGLDPRRVGRQLSTMVARKELVYEKQLGEYGTYSFPEYVPIEVEAGKVKIENYTLKLAQLRSYRDVMRRAGVTMIDEIIKDFEKL